MHNKTDIVQLDDVYNNTYRAAPVIPITRNGKYGNTSAFPERRQSHPDAR